MDVTPDDFEHLERAAELGRRGWGRVHPNPAVGCVLVRDGRVVGAGWHEEFGAPHAEVHALESAGADAAGATAYVSLEPCRHRGKTPACTDQLLRADVQRVVYGAADPTSGAGGGAEVLRQAGLDVSGPLFGPKRARRENPAFFHRAVSERPYLTLKLATSLDGKIAASPGERTPLTGAPAREAAHRLRAGFDAILIGSETAVVDDPLLTVREGVVVRKEPARVVLDSRARLGVGAALFRDVETAPVVVFTRVDAPESRLEALEDAGAVVHPVSSGEDGQGLKLHEVLEICRETGLEAILCEGGARLARSLLEEDLVERLHLFVAPRFLGGEGVGAFRELPRLDEPWEPVTEPRRHGDDVELVYDRPRPWSHGPSGERLWEPATDPSPSAFEGERS